MNKTNFQKVQDFNRAFDMVPQNPSIYLSYNKNPFIHIRPQLFIDDIPIITLRLDLIDEEIKELNTAIADNDIIETRDALADILYVVYGFADVLGINIDSYFNTYFLSILIDNKINSTYLNIKNVDNMNLFKNIIVNKNIFIFKCDCSIYKCSCSMNLINSINNFNKTQILVDCIYDGIDNNNNNNNDLITKSLHTIQTNINNNYKYLKTYCITDYYITKCCCICYCGTNTLACDCICNDDANCINKFKSIADYIINILHLVYSYIYLLEYNADTDFDIVHNSNMSKLCDTLEDAQNTVADYINKFNLGLSIYDSPYYYELPLINKWIVKNKSTGKALKNIKYHKVIFT